MTTADENGIIVFLHLLQSVRAHRFSRIDRDAPGFNLLNIMAERVQREAIQGNPPAQHPARFRRGLKNMAGIAQHGKEPRRRESRRTGADHGNLLLLR